MKLMFFGIMLNIIGAIASYYSVIGSTGSAQAATTLMIVMVCFWLLSAIGGFLVIMDKNSRLGTTLAIIGSAIFVPLGMVAIIGAIKLKNSQGVDLSERRKRLYEEKNMDDQSTVAINSNVEQKRIFPAKDVRTLRILAGVFFSVFGLFGPGFFLSIGILSIILGCIAKYDQYVTLGSDYIAIKAPIGIKKEILFDEISSIVNHDNKKITLHYIIAGSDKVKKAVIALNLIAEPKKSELIYCIDKLDANNSASGFISFYY